MFINLINITFANITSLRLACLLASQFAGQRAVCMRAQCFTVGARAAAAAAAPSKNNLFRACVHKAQFVTSTASSSCTNYDVPIRIPNYLAT